MEYYTTEQVAQQLGITLQGLRTWIYRNQFTAPSYTIGVNTMWTEQDIDRLIEVRRGARRGRPFKQVTQ